MPAAEAGTGGSGCEAGHGEVASEGPGLYSFQVFGFSSKEPASQGAVTKIISVRYCCSKGCTTGGANPLFRLSLIYCVAVMSYCDKCTKALVYVQGVV